MKNLEQLREDLKAMEHAEGLFVFNDEFSIEFYRMKEKIIREIATLESDPWREAKERIEVRRSNGNSPCLVAYIDHLTAENARLTKRVAELEAAASDVTELLEMTDEADDPSTDSYVAVKMANAALADMQPPFEGPIVGFEPILDPARVLATAAEIFDQKGQFSMRMVIAFYCQGATPYRLKGTDE